MVGGQVEEAHEELRWSLLKLHLQVVVREAENAKLESREWRGSCHSHTCRWCLSGRPLCKAQVHNLVHWIKLICTNYFVHA